jgi:hypothetical protein
MLTMDVFKQDAFSAQSLTASVDKLGFVPNFLGTVPGLFVPPPLGQPRTKDVFIESRGNDAALIQTSPRGAPPSQRGGDRGEARPFKTSRLAKASRITADELQGIRQFGSETELKQLQTEMARRQLLIKNDFDLTKENMRLGAVQGLVKDADGSTIYDWASEFGQTIPAEVDFDLDNASPAAGVLRQKCTAAVRSITRGLKGLGGNSVRIMSICGDDFWDNLIAHQEVRATYLNYQAAAALRDPVAWETFNFGGITWTNYRGTDDGSTVAVPAAKAKFFPVGAGIFQECYAPAERFEFVNTPGQPTYSWVVVDDERDMWADVEVYSYPLYVCTMPQALYRAKYT